MMNSITADFARETIASFQMAWAAQRLYDEAYCEGETDTGPYDEDAAWQHKMDTAEQMLEAAEAMTDDVEARAIAAGVDVTDMLHLVNGLCKDDATSA